MAVDVRPSVLVRRPRAEVAAFMFDPANDLKWTGGITASKPAQPGPLVRGARLLGRTFAYGYVVTEHQPGSLVEMKDAPQARSSRSTRAGTPAGSSAGPPR
ncbi:hypothetical protein [Actinocrispum sp. NPDC049592]|uniref:hypothetical protein n=1 Tax=Actinocrispum sp. NPDC049592 TaxID=3154835 RepID=UPI0034336286